jgi:hypothetical protein
MLVAAQEVLTGFLRFLVDRAVRVQIAARAVR